MTNFNAKCEIVKPTLENMSEAGRKIKAGGLVAFPTETVYGLGANALDKDAVLSIFQAKGRPLTDPVIVHIIDREYAKSLLKLSEHQSTVFDVLASHFWPGPLTIVALASELVPPIVTANTGFVGVRYPKHLIAQELIRHSTCPIAAPSANRFGHVSPTLPIHVFDDLGASEITILDVDDSNKPCEIGIESTVIKMVEDDQIYILRKGGVSENQLRQVLSTKFPSLTLTAINKQVSMESKINQEAPGQLITHYAPDIQTFILNNDSSSSSSQEEESNSILIDTKDCIYIDFGGHLEEKKRSNYLEYKDLSRSSDILEAANQLFSILRWSESIGDAKAILLPNLKDKTQFTAFDHTDAVFDRIFRASSGRFAFTRNNKIIIKQE